MNKKICLNGEWTFSEKGTGQFKKGIVPGCVQMDLIRMKELPDPFYGLNEIAFQPLEEKEWIYRKEFILEKTFSDYYNVRLDFEGLDTYAAIYVNGIYVGKTENMLIPHSFEIKTFLKEGLNEIEVHFDSTVRRAKALQKNSAQDLEYCCEPAAPYVRKAHYSFGWDWSPRLLQTGIWRPVCIELIDKVEILNPFVYTRWIKDEHARVHLETEIKASCQMQLRAVVSISMEGNVKAKVETPISMNRGKLKASMDMDIPEVKLWFPNGMGEQPLYDVKIEIFNNDEYLTESSFRTGIRMVRLIREKDAEGESFIFEVNGYKVFAKGANWVPADNLIPRLVQEDYHDYIKAARDANMNMLMAWGGGVYEDPAFYEACDEMGIMIWQTFMFHYSEYPVWNESFIGSIRKEAETIINRLRNHPCIVLWCGECENTWAFPGKDKYRGSMIYTEILPEICSELDNSREYRVGTPYGGKDPNCMSEGDRHSYDVYLNWQDFEVYRKDTSRFLSEFGVQSMPDWKTVLQYTPEEELSLLSPTSLSHNKLPEGMERLIRYMTGRLGLPRDFRSFVYLSQFNQAEAMKIAVEHWRSRMFSTAGTLFWQFNDCWPGTSFSCIDYYRRRKFLYYYCKRFYDKILPIVKPDENRIKVCIVNDFTTNTEVSVKVSCYKFDGRKLSELCFSAHLTANTAETVKVIAFKELGIGNKPVPMPLDERFTNVVKEKNGELNEIAFYIEVEAKGQVYRNYMVFDKFRQLSIQKPCIQAEVSKRVIKLHTNVPVFGVFIETENDIQLSDNGLIMEPGVDYSVLCSDVPGNIAIVNICDLLTRI